MSNQLLPKKVMLLGIPVMKINEDTKEQFLAHLTYGIKLSSGTYEFAMSGHGPSTRLSDNICKVNNTYVSLTSINGIDNGQRTLTAPLFLKGSRVYGEVKCYGRFGEYGRVMYLVPLPAHEVEIADPIVGPAQILTTLKGNTPLFYNIIITEVDIVEGVGKYFFFDFKDSRLTATLGDSTKKGMSGAPIVQNKNFVGVYGRSTPRGDTKIAFSAKDMINEHIEGIYVCQNSTNDLQNNTASHR